MDARRKRKILIQIQRTLLLSAISIINILAPFPKVNLKNGRLYAYLRWAALHKSILKLGEFESFIISTSTPALGSSWMLYFYSTEQ